MAVLRDIKKSFLLVSKEEAMGVLEGIRASRLIQKKSTKSKSLKKKIVRKYQMEDMLHNLSLEEAERIVGKMERGEI